MPLQVEPAVERTDFPHSLLGGGHLLYHVHRSSTTSPPASPPPSPFPSPSSPARTAPEDRDAAKIERSIAACAKHLAVLDAHLATTPYLSGSDFGIGDIPMGVYIHTWSALPFDKPAFANVTAWYERIRSRAGYADNVMIPLT